MHLPFQRNFIIVRLLQNTDHEKMDGIFNCHISVKFICPCAGLTQVPTQGSFFTFSYLEERKKLQSLSSWNSSQLTLGQINVTMY